MGYYLSIDYPDLGLEGVSIGGKFFGYLDDAEFEECWSYQYLQGKVEEPELLNVAWSCYSFELTKQEAIAFLRYYANDVRKHKGEAFTRNIYALRSDLYLMDFEGKVKFSMG